MTCFMDPVYCDLNCLPVSTPISQYIPLYQYISLFYTMHILLPYDAHSVNCVTYINKMCIGSERAM